MKMKNRKSNQIAKKIRQLRLVHNYTQTYVANEIGIKQNTYSLLENGTITITKDRLMKIASIYHLSVDELITWEPGIVNVPNTTSDSNSINSFLDNSLIDELYTKFENLNDTINLMNERILSLIEARKRAVDKMKNKK